MPNIATVTLTAGAPTAGTGTVSTLDNLIGTAGTASAQVLSVQGIASGTALAVSQSGTWNVGTVTTVTGVTTVSTVTTVSAVTAITNALPTGANVIGKTTQPAMVTTSATQTVTASSAYAAGNCIGGKITFSSCVRANDATAFVQKVLVQSKSLQTFPCDLILFNADPSGSTITDKTAISVATADFDKVIGVVHVSDWTAMGIASLGEAIATGVCVSPTSGGTTIYGALVSRGTPTFTATSDIKVVIVTQAVD